MNETREYTWIDRAIDEGRLDYLDDLAERLDDISWACRGEWAVPQSGLDR